MRGLSLDRMLKHAECHNLVESRQTTETENKRERSAAFEIQFNLRSRQGTALMVSVFHRRVLKQLLQKTNLLNSKKFCHDIFAYTEFTQDCNCMQLNCARLGG